MAERLEVITVAIAYRVVEGSLVGQVAKLSATLVRSIWRNAVMLKHVV